MDPSDSKEKVPEVRVKAPTAHMLGLVSDIVPKLTVMIQWHLPIIFQFC